MAFKDILFALGDIATEGQLGKTLSTLDEIKKRKQLAQTSQTLAGTVGQAAQQGGFVEEPATGIVTTAIRGGQRVAPQGTDPNLVSVEPDIRKPVNARSITPLEESATYKGQLAQALAAENNLATALTRPQVVSDVAGYKRFAGGLRSGERVAPQAKALGKTDSLFAKINPEKYTQESVKTFQDSGDYSKLQPRPEFLRKLTTGKPKSEAEKDLRKEFTSMSQVYRDVRDSFQRVLASTESPSAAGDLALIFNFMKILDPGSVVRESEFANAQTAQPLLERLGISWDAVGRVWRGERLADEARRDFLNRAKALFKKQETQHRKREGIYKGIANRNKLDVNNVVIDLNAPEFEQSLIEAEAEEAPPEGAQLLPEAATKDGKPIYRLPDGRLWAP